MSKAKTPYPEWAIIHRRPGTEIRRIGEKFYMYQVSSYYDKDKKAGRKKTGKYLGTITEDNGFVAAKFKKVARDLPLINTENLSTKEFGLSNFIQTHCSDIIDPLKVFFPQLWEWILVALYCRLAHSSPMKNMGYYFKKSYLSETFDINLNAKAISLLVRQLGDDRKPVTDYMKQIAGDEKFLLIDATSMVSYSNNLTKVDMGLSKNKQYEPIFNLLYLYSPNTYLPAYYRIFNGNIKDVTMLSMTLKESNYKNAIIVGDKGFFSEENLKELEEQALKYIVPLRRNSSLIDYEKYADLTKRASHFLFENRVIYYHSYPSQNNRIIYLFIDEQMMLKEKRDFIARKEKGLVGYTDEEFTIQIARFGTFSIIANMDITPREIYINYKSRMGIELLFDGTKNILGNDFTYMQNDEALEGWMFINHLALLIHHKIYQLLKEKNMLSKYSIRDFIEYLADVKKVKINDDWILEPIIKEQQKLLQSIGLSIP